MDQRQSKQGKGIWVHGTNEELKEHSTNGCIVLTNGDLVQLDPCIRIWDSPIIVEDTLRPEICNPQSSITPRDLSIE